MPPYRIIDFSTVARPPWARLLICEPAALRPPATDDLLLIFYAGGTLSHIDSAFVACTVLWYCAKSRPHHQRWLLGAYRNRRSQNQRGSTFVACASQPLAPNRFGLPAGMRTTWYLHDAVLYSLVFLLMGARWDRRASAGCRRTRKKPRLGWRRHVRVTAQAYLTRETTAPLLKVNTRHGIFHGFLLSEGSPAANDESWSCLIVAAGLPVSSQIYRRNRMWQVEEVAENHGSRPASSVSAVRPSVSGVRASGLGQTGV